MAAATGQVELAKVDVDANPELARDIRDPGHPGRQGLPRRPGRLGVRRRPAAGRHRALPRRARALRGRRAGRRRRRGLAAPGRRARALAADAAVPLARLLHARGDRDGALSSCARCPEASPPTGWRRGSAWRPTRVPSLGAAFTRLDGGDPETGARRPDRRAALAPTEPRTTSAASSSGSSTSSASSTRWRATPAAGWPPRCTRRCRADQSARRELLVGGRRLEPGDAHAEQPHRAGRREPAQQVQRHRADPISGPDRLAQRAGARMGREVVEADLDADRAPAPFLTLERGAQLADQARQDRLELREPGDVEVKRRLPRLGDHLAHLGHRDVVLEAGAALQLGAQPGPEARRQLVRPARRPACPACRARTPAAARPSWVRSRGSARRARRRSATRACSLVRHTKPRGFSASEATLATSLLGPIPIEAAQAGGPLDRRARAGASRPAGRASRSDPGRPRRARSPRPTRRDRPHERHHLARGLAVVGVSRAADRRPSGHRRRARAAGIAEPTPKRRAS